VLSTRPGSSSAMMMVTVRMRRQLLVSCMAMLALLLLA
jgi:hypothetical protein